MFTLFKVSIQFLDNLGTELRVIPESGHSFHLSEAWLHRVPDAGWVGYCLAEQGGAVLYFKRDEGKGCCLHVTKPGTYRFGRLINGALASAIAPETNEYEWWESEAAWGWFPEDAPDKPEINVPGFITDKRPEPVLP